MKTSPYSWKKITEEIAKEAKNIPLWGSPPPFPWDSFASLLKKQLGTPDLHIQSRKIDWTPPGRWSEGLGSKPTVLSFEAPVLKGRLYWAASSEEVKAASLALLTSSGQISENAKATPLPFLKGFYRFLALQALDALAQTKAFPGMQISLSDKEAIPDETLFSIEIELTCKGVKTFGRILLPLETLASFREFYRVEGQTVQSKERASRIPVALSLVVGKTTLRHTAWKEITVGDLLLLDRCDFDIKNKRGSAHLAIGEKTIANCAIDGRTLEMLEYPTHEEETMKPDEDEPEEEFSSFDDPEDEDFDEEEFDEDMDDDEEETEEPAEEEVEEEEDKAPEDMEVVKEPLPLTKELPITLCVEVARLKMSLDKVLGLQPGNVLDLLVSPEQGVTLTAGGRAVARGELVQIGEVLGVKITELG